MIETPIVTEISLAAVEMPTCPRWAPRLRVWRRSGEWRVRLFRRRGRVRYLETECESLAGALWALGVGAGWWKP